MEGNENYGVILKHLREQMKLSVRKFSKKINRSIGWISEIENGTGTARLTSAEFDSLVELLDAGKWRGQFRTWVANYKNAERVDRTFEGAILKHVRVKKGIRLEDAAKLAEMSPCYLSQIENGHKPPPLAVRNRVLGICGYSPASFKNLSTDPVRSKVVPDIYKLNILLKKLSEPQITEIFDLAKRLIEGGVR